MSERRLLVLCWHNVEATPFFGSPPGAGSGGLEAQLRLLRRVATPVSLRSALQALYEGRALPRRSVALTFDDGYRDNLDIAAPMLGRLGLPATFLLVPGLLSGEVKAWWEQVSWAFERTPRTSIDWEGATWRWEDQAARFRCRDSVIEALKRRDGRSREAAVAELVSALAPPEGDVPDLFLDWDGARRLASLGFEVGSHTLTHPILSEEAPIVQATELNESRRLLQEGTGHEVDVVAYPNGTPLDYDTTTIEAARAAGYSYGLTVLEGWNGRHTPPYEINRFVVYPDRGAIGLAVVLRTALASFRARLQSGSPISR